MLAELPRNAVLAPAPQRIAALRERRGSLLSAPLRDSRAYLHSQDLLFVFPSASALYSKTTATVFRRRKFGESL